MIEDEFGEDGIVIRADKTKCKIGEYFWAGEYLEWGRRLYIPTSPEDYGYIESSCPINLDLPEPMEFTPALMGVPAWNRDGTFRQARRWAWKRVK